MEAERLSEDETIVAKRQRSRHVIAPTSLDWPVVGWREWVALPEFGVETIKAKMDTGARTSAIHAKHIQHFQDQGQPMVRFTVHPAQRSTRHPVSVIAEVVDERKIRSSSGHAKRRPVIVTELELAGQRWPIELTLANRSLMGFRLLLGRQALRHRFFIDPGRSFLLSPKK